MRQTAIRLCVFIFLLCVGCNSETYKSYNGNTIEIKYSRTDTITAGQWIEIGSHRFKHVGTMKELHTVQNALPSTRLVIDTSSGGVVATAESAKSTSIYIAQHLSAINTKKVNRGQDEPTYEMGSRPLIQLEGTLRLSKSNSGVVRVGVPYGYPAKIRVLD